MRFETGWWKVTRCALSLETTQHQFPETKSTR
jgi:hypothetical protein